MKKIRFGLIGCGLMGREFASAVARWAHLPEMEARPEIVAICDLFDAARTGLARWYTENFPTIRQVTNDYRELVANPEIEAVYCAVPHHLHAALYGAVIEAGKHLMGEKPFGIDLAANTAILSSIQRHPECVVRCSSEFPFFPAAQRIGDLIERKAFGTIIEVNAGFLHSSDLDPNKPMNWKRQIEYNGEYGFWETWGCILATCRSGRGGDRETCGRSCRILSRNVRMGKAEGCPTSPGTMPRCCAKLGTRQARQPFP